MSSRLGAWPWSRSAVLQRARSCQHALRHGRTEMRVSSRLGVWPQSPKAQDFNAQGFVNTRYAMSESGTEMRGVFEARCMAVVQKCRTSTHKALSTRATP